MNLSFLVLQIMGVTAFIAVLGKVKKLVDKPELLKRKENGTVHIFHNIIDLVILALVGLALGYGIALVADAYFGGINAISPSGLLAIGVGIGMIAEKAWEIITEAIEYAAEKVRERFKKKVDRYADDDD
jgi:hypothetical protein